MDYLVMYETWLILAIIFGVAEFILPGGISLNLSISSLLVTLGLRLNFLETWVSVLTAWFLIASILFFVIYYFTKKIFKSDETIGNVHEELDIFGQEVQVLENIGPGEKKGRVEFQGTTWSALGDGSEIPAGTQVRIICKDNISLVVEVI
jgi:membrane protein implicated in regulation of membrane protease activity